MRIESSESNDTDLNGSFETAGNTITYLVDHNNHTGYPQTITEITKDNTGTETKRVTYTFGHDEISQTTVDTSGTETLHFGHDGHGSVRVLLDALGAIAVVATVEQLFHFTAYGVAHGFNPSQAATNRLFNSEPRDTTTGLYYHDARWFDPTTGRWNRLDPFFGNIRDPQSFHKYLYVHGDPINGSDPSGLVTLGSVNVVVATIGTGATVGAAAVGSVYAKFSNVSAFKGVLLGTNIGISLAIAQLQGPGTLLKAIGLGIAQGVTNAFVTSLIHGVLLGNAGFSSVGWYQFTAPPSVIEGDGGG